MAGVVQCLWIWWDFQETSLLGATDAKSFALGVCSLLSIICFSSFSFAYVLGFTTDTVIVGNLFI